MADHSGFAFCCIVYLTCHLDVTGGRNLVKWEKCRLVTFSKKTSSPIIYYRRFCVVGPFKCYVTQMGVGGQIFQEKALRRCKVKRY